MSIAFRYDMDFGAGWTDVTADIYVMPGDTVTWARGIMSNRPDDHVANTGTFTFALDNSATNSGGTQAWYTPNHVHCRPGFTFGIPVRVIATYLSTDYPLWRGKVRAILPEAGQYRSKRVLCTAYDCMNDLYEADLRSIAPQVGKTEVELLQAVLAALPSTSQPPATSYDAALDSYPYAFYDIGGDGVKALTAMSDVVLSAQGWLYPKGDGTLRYENRHTITTKTPICTFDNSMRALVVPSDLANVYNRIRVITHQPVVDAAATTVLWSLPSGQAPAIAAGQSLEIWGDYFDPSNSLKLIGGTAQVTPIVSTTDYVANAAADGSGADQTASLSVTTSAFAAAVKFVLSNTSGATIYVTKLQLRGKGIYDNAPATVETYTPRAYGDRPYTLDLRYQNSTTVAKDMADYISALYSLLSGQAASITFLATGGYEDHALDCDLGDMVIVSEEMTGMAAVPVVLRGMSWVVAPGPWIEVTWFLSPMLAGSVFRLDDAIRGQLDNVNATLGYA